MLITTVAGALVIVEAEVSMIAAGGGVLTTAKLETLVAAVAEVIDNSKLIKELCAENTGVGSSVKAAGAKASSPDMFGS